LATTCPHLVYVLLGGALVHMLKAHGIAAQRVVTPVQTEGFRPASVDETKCQPMRPDRPGFDVLNFASPYLELAVRLTRE
jgi:hypothetical protein